MTPDTTMPARYHDGFGGHYYASTVACAVGSEFQTMDEALDDFVERLGDVEEATVYFADTDHGRSLKKYYDGADVLTGAGFDIAEVRVMEGFFSIAYMVRVQRKSIPAALSPRGDGPSDRGRPCPQTPVAPIPMGLTGLSVLMILMILLMAGSALAWRAW